MTTKKLTKYPDGGTITTGTPEHKAYLAQQQRAKEWQERYNTLDNSGYYSNPTNATRAEIDEFTPKLMSPLSGDQAPSGYTKYSYDPTKTAPNLNLGTGTESFYTDPNSGSYYVPRYDAPTESTIIKSEADLATEKKIQENKEFSEKYQGYVHNVYFDNNTNSNQVEKTPLPIGAEIPTDGTFHSTSTTNKEVVKPILAGGGKLGDTFKFAGDNLLSVIGLTDVINDDMYRNQSFANASKIGEKLGIAAGQVAANIFFPGIGGAALGAAQAVNSKLDGEDLDRERMAQLGDLKDQDALGKFNNAAYSGSGIPDFDLPKFNSGNSESTMPSFNKNMYAFGGNPSKQKEMGLTFRPQKYGEQNYFDYFNNLDAIEGGDGISGNEIPINTNTNYWESLRRAMLINKNTRESGRDVGRVKSNAFVYKGVDDKVQFAGGGNLTKYPDGGGFIEYQGDTHANGGIPINDQGMPTNSMNATKEVEGGETMNDNGIDKYVFSDRLVIDPKTKVTFADASKKVNKKYPNVNDKIQKETREIELNRLKQQQEEFKASIASISEPQMQPQMGYGGKMKYPDGGPLYNNHLTPFSEIPSPWIGSVEDYYNAQNQHNIPDSPLEANNTIYDPITGESFQLGSQNKSGEETFGNGTGVRGNYKSASSTNTEEGLLPQDKINPLGFAASNIGNIYDLAQSSKPSPNNVFDKVDFQGVDYAPQREELRKQAGVSTALGRENARQLATSSGQAMSNQVINNALINSNLGSGLSDSFMTQANTNSQIANSAESANTQIKNEEIIANQLDSAKRISTISQALHSTGANTQGYAHDLKSAKVGNENNKLWFDAIKSGKYVNLDYQDGEMIMTLKDGTKITQPKNK